MKTTSELLDRFVELFNDDRFDEIPGDYSPGAIAEEIGTHRRVSPEESAEDARAWRKAFPDARGTITTKVVEGNKGAAEIVWRHITRIGNLPIFSPLRWHVWARVAAAHRDHGIKLANRDLCQCLRSMGRQVVTQLRHGRDGLGIHAT